MYLCILNDDDKNINYGAVITQWCLNGLEWLFQCIISFSRLVQFGYFYFVITLNIKHCNSWGLSIKCRNFLLVSSQKCE